MKNTGVKAYGIEAPLIREGDDIVKVVVDSVLDATTNGEELNNEKDVIAITESVVARAGALYVTVDDIAEDIKKKFGKNPTICLTDMIYSRNRFSLILRGFARGAKKLILVMENYDEVGNPRGKNPFTGVDIEEFYKELIKNEDCEVEILHRLRTIWNENPNLIYKGVDYIKEKIDGFIDCSLHTKGKFSGLGFHSWYCFHPVYLLSDICADKNPDFGLLGSNKATEERLKLFPTKKMADEVCNNVMTEIKEKTGKEVIVMVYGDGSYKDLDAGIWEMADPVSSPGYTHKELLNGTPNEVKLKSVIDNTASNAEVRKIVNMNKGKNLVGKMTSMGTTPRKFINLLASLCDLVSGSGSRATPIILIQNYF